MILARSGGPEGGVCFVIYSLHHSLWTEVCDIVQEAVIKTIPKKKKSKKAKQLRKEEKLKAKEKRKDRPI